MVKIADILEWVLKKLVIVLIIVMTIIVVIGIFSRYIFLYSIPWTEELSRYLMVWTGFLAFGVAYRKKELISVKLVTGILPPKLFNIAMFVSDILCSVFLVVVIYYGAKLCQMNSYQVSPAARIPMSIIYAAIPLGCIIFLVFVAESVVLFVTGKKEVS